MSKTGDSNFHKKNYFIQNLFEIILIYLNFHQKKVGFPMRKILIFLATLISMSLADPPTGKYDFAVKWIGGTNTSTAWTIDGNSVYPIDVYGKKVCHYVGRIVSDAENNRCPTITIRHLAKMAAEYEDDSNPKKWLGLWCYYDYLKIGSSDFYWAPTHLRKNCPDILVTQGKEVVAEFFFEEMENQADYYEDKNPITQTVTPLEEVGNAFGEKYENQIKYRDSYDWINLKPRPWKPRQKTYR